MSALSPKAVMNHSATDVGFVPILLQKSAIDGIRAAEAIS
jgi:hypothetical protein